MEDEERRLFLERIHHLEHRLASSEAKTQDFDEFLMENKLYADSPKDQFSHQYKLVFHPTKEISHRSKRSDLFNPDLLLGNVKDTKTLAYFQREYSLLHRFFDMGQRSEGVMDLFNNLYYAWVGQLRLTGALGGNERRYQSFLDPDQMPYESYSFLEKRKMEKQKRKLSDYLNALPGRRGGGGIYD